MDSYAVVSMLKKDGRMLKSFKGGRHSFKKEGMRFIVTITHPGKDVPIGQLKDISRKSGLKF